jgi:hypothetical protein
VEGSATMASPNPRSEPDLLVDEAGVDVGAVANVRLQAGGAAAIRVKISRPAS